MGRRRLTGRTPRALVAAVLTGLLLSGFALTGTTSSRAEDPVLATATNPIRVTLTGLAPVSLTDATALSASGKISNSGLETLRDVNVRLTISTQPLPNRRSLRLGGDIGTTVETVPLYDSSKPVARALRPGAKRQYRLSAAKGTIPLPSPGVYVVGVEVTGVGASGLVILGSTHTLVPYLPEPVEPVNVTWMWPLAGWPAQSANGVLVDDKPSKEIAPGGRLDHLLSVGRTVPTLSWIVDPQLMQMTVDMADGYLVERDGGVRPGSAQQPAAAWLAGVREVLAPTKKSSGEPPDLVGLSYADPDTDALIRGGLTSDVIRATTDTAPMLDEFLGRTPDSLVAWASGGRMTTRSIDALAAAGVTAVLLRDNAMPVSGELPYTPSGYADIATEAGPVRALLVDSGLLRALTLPQGNLASILQARQRFVSELAFVALEPAPQPRYLVAAAGSVRWDPNPRLLAGIVASLRGTSWTRLVPVSTMLALPPSNVTRAFDGGNTKSRSRELSADYLDRVQQTQDDIASLRSILSRPLPVVTPLNDTLLRAESTAWRTRTKTGLMLLDSVDADIEKTVSGVYVIPRSDVTLSGDRGKIPVTVANDLGQAVTVGVRVTATPSSRLEAEPLTEVLIDAGTRASLEIPVRIVGGGALNVAVELTDGNGMAFGTAAPLELRTTAYSRAATWVAVAAAVVLVLLVIFDIVRRARGRRRASTRDSAGEPA